MRCVSYTRAVSGCWAIELEKNAVQLQNAAIREFVKKQGWKIGEKYSDNKKDENAEVAFLQMKEDGINRKFDCVVVSSMFYAGRNITAAYDLFFSVFYSAGISFAVAEDDFCSFGKSEDEVKVYLQKCKTLYRGEMASQIASRQTPERAYRKYGYIWIADTTLEIDDEVAPIVKEIFDLCRNGYSLGNIAKLFNERGIDSPIQYEGRKIGRENKINRKGWNGSTVKLILANEMYIGKWKRCIRGVDYEYACPPIIEKEVFDKAAAQIYERNNCKDGKHSSAFGWYSAITADMETQHPLASGLKLSDGTKVLRFRYPAPVTKPYDKFWISAEDLQEKAYAELMKEQRAARYIAKLISEGEAETEKNAQLADIRARALDVTMQMANNEKVLMKQSRSCESGELDEDDYSVLYAEHMEKQAELDNTLQSYLEIMDEIEQAFSLKNPWITRFYDFDTEEVFTNKGAKKYITKVWVYRFDTVQLEFILSEWKKRFPQAWLLEGR